MKEIKRDKTRKGHTLIKALEIMVLAFLILVGVTGAQANENSNSKWVNGYYTGYDSSMLPPQDIYWSGMTHIVMGAVLANPDGSLNTDFYIDPTNGPLLAQQISKLAHQNHKKAILMLGGEGNGANIASAVKNHQSLFISNLVTVMNAYGYDGIDLDWEDNVDYTQFASFAKALRKAAPNAILTMPIGCINANYQTVDPGIVELSQYMNQMNLVSYYPGTLMTGYGWYSWFNSPLKGEKPNTPISIENSLSLYNASGIPKNKLGMGISFYAIGYAGTPTITGPNQTTETTNYIVGGDNQYPLSKLFGTNWKNNEKYLHWSDEADEPYLSLPSPDWSGAQYISFENPQSIIEKGKFAKENGYGGIIIWTINQGYVSTSPDPNFLMEALQTGFMEPVNLVANFTSNVTSGYAPLSAQFTDISTGTPTSWNWNFGDGTSSTKQNPVHTYSKIGKYTVSLTVENADGRNSTSKLNYINVVTPKVPTAAFSASPTYGKAPLTVTFTDKSTNLPTSWNWNFGDGSASTEQNPAHVYGKAGQYTVKLKVKNAAGSSSASKSNYITVTNPLKPPTASFSASPISGKAPLTVTFTDKSTNSPDSWKWSFGDGNSSTEQNPVHTYSNAGQYTVKLKVKNEAGSSTKTLNKYITVKK